MPTPFLPFLPASGDISDGVPFFYPAATSTAQNGVLSTHQAALYALGVGVVPTASNALLVSAGTGLRYNLTAGFTVVRHSTRGPFFLIQSAVTNEGPLAANRGVGNEIYLFLVAQRETFNDSAITAKGELIAWDNNTYDGGILLATITTGASSISNVTPNVARFNELKIHDLTEDTTPDPDDELVIWDSATGRLQKITIANLKTTINSGVQLSKETFTTTGQTITGTKEFVHVNSASATTTTLPASVNNQWGMLMLTSLGVGAASFAPNTGQTTETGSNKTISVQFGRSYAWLDGTVWRFF